MRAACRAGGQAYTRTMDNDTLRVLLAAALGPLFWDAMRGLWRRIRDSLPGASRRAEAERRRREEAQNRAASLGRQLGRWLSARSRRSQRR